MQTKTIAITSYYTEDGIFGGNSADCDVAATLDKYAEVAADKIFLAVKEAYPEYYVEVSVIEGWQNDSINVNNDELDYIAEENIASEISDLIQFGVCEYWYDWDIWITK